MERTAEGGGDDEPIRRRGMGAAVASQCFGALPTVFIQSGLLLLYLISLGIRESTALALISSLNLPDLLRIFLAHHAEKRGLKGVGVMAILINSSGLLSLACAAWFPEGQSRWVMVLLGCALVALSSPALGAIWFPLLQALIPEAVRGRFFGVLRFSWQVVALIFLGVCTTFLSEGEAMHVYSNILLVLFVLQFFRWWFFRKIPDFSPPPSSSDSGVARDVKAALAWPGLASFAAYVFLLGAATGAARSCFTLAEKVTLSLGDDRVVLLSNLTLLGNVLGFVMGGWVIDRYGTKLVFLVGHFGAGCLIASFVARDLWPLPLMVSLGSVHFCLGLVLSAVSVAVTTEQFGLLPDRGRAVALAMMGSTTMLGTAFSGFLASVLVERGLFSSSWSLGSSQLGPYDALLTLMTISVLLLSVTLGLIPSVLKQHRHIPQI